MILFFKVIWRVLTRVVYFSCFGFFAMLIHGLIVGAIIGFLLALIQRASDFLLGTPARLTPYGTPKNEFLDFMETIVTFGGANAGFAAAFGCLAFAIAAVITSLRDRDYSLSDVFVEAIWGSLCGTLLGVVLWPCAIQLFKTAWIWKSVLPVSTSLEHAIRIGMIGGFCVGIFFGAIYGAQGKELPTHQILPTLRRWLKMSTHGK